MGKWLSIEEKLNAEKELEYNRSKIKHLREVIQALNYRNKKLTNYLENRHRSKYNGLYGINGTCYKMFGKKACDLTAEERTEYNRVKQAEYRSK